MRKNVLQLLMLLMVAIPLVFITSCTDDGDDEPETNEFLPILNDNFSFEVSGNNVNFTTTITGNVWVTANSVDYPFVDQKVTVNLPKKGTYAFTCSSLGSGEVLTSDPFNVDIEIDDIEFLNHGLWLYLSGGANKTKTWRLDMTAEAEVVYFDGPMYFSGYATDTERKTEWSYWAWDVLPEELPYTVNGAEQASFFNWSPAYDGNEWIMAAGDYGTITFDGTAGTVSMVDITGAEHSGSFTFDSATWKLNLTGVILPIDTARLNEPQFTDENLAAVRIFSLTDSAMQIGIKRSYEGFAEDGTQNPSEWVNVYNFIVDTYNYPVPEEFTYSEPVLTTLTANDLVGTWKYADVPFDWVGWKGTGDQGSTIDPVPLNNWADAAAMLGTGWLSLSQEQLDAAYALEFVFGDDGSASINGVSTTYTVDAGVITFGEEVKFTIGDHWFSVTAANSLKALDVPGAAGLWIGNQNEAKSESACVHIVKQ